MTAMVFLNAKDDGLASDGQHHYSAIGFGTAVVKCRSRPSHTNFVPHCRFSCCSSAMIRVAAINPSVPNPNSMEADLQSPVCSQVLRPEVDEDRRG